MLTEPQCQPILELHAKGMGIRRIARTLNRSRHTVRWVLSEGKSPPPRPGRAHLAAARAVLQGSRERGEGPAAVA